MKKKRGKGYPKDKTRDQSICFYCTRIIHKKSYTDDDQWTIDHLTPLSRGGENIPENRVDCCYPCNQRKGQMSAEAFTAILRREKEKG